MENPNVGTQHEGPSPSRAAFEVLHLHILSSGEQQIHLLPVAV